MSNLQRVVFIGVLCAVNAAVTVNVYEDDVETIRTNKAREVESCNTEACDRICRLLGFNSGICVGDTCECRKSLKDADQLKHNDIHSLDEGVIGTELGGCDPNACYQLCRRLKFPSGTCVNGRCKCDNFRQEPDQLEQNDILSLDEGIRRKELGGCDPLACYQLCRRLKFPSGTCVNGRCKCDNFRQDTDNLEQNDILSLDEGLSRKELGGCDPLACYQLCRRLKFPSGTCVNGRCRCDNFRQDPENPIIETMDNGVPNQVLAGCTNSACSTLCHILGYRYGVCINNNTCKCSNVLRTDVLEISLDQGINEYIVNAVERNVDTVMPNTVRDCDQMTCTMGCLELGAPGGSCSLGKCRCNERGGEEETKTSLRSCISVICIQQCLQSNHLGGRCRNGRCECF